MKFYTHIAQWGNQLLVRSVENGVRSNYKVKYEPTLYVPVKKDTGWKTLDGKNVSPMKFLSIKEAKEFVETISKSTPSRVWVDTVSLYLHFRNISSNRLSLTVRRCELSQLILRWSVRTVSQMPIQPQNPHRITIKNHDTGRIKVWGLMITK